MNIKKILLCPIGLMLAVTLTVQQLPLSHLKAEAASINALPAYKVMIYTDKFKTNHFSHILDLSNIKDFPKYVIEAAKDARARPCSRDDWTLLTKYDLFTPGEIHRRVQDDLWYRYEDNGVLNGGELPMIYDENFSNKNFNINIDGELVSLPYPDLLSGRADIYKYNSSSSTSLWEVKPPSYWTVNRVDGIIQLSQYVTFGVNDDGKHVFRYGETETPNLLNPKKNNTFSFNSYYLCSDIGGVNIWVEQVTYDVRYTITKDSLIIYNFTRKTSETPSVPDPALLPLYKKALDELKKRLKDKKTNTGNSPQPGYSYAYDPAEEPAYDPVDEPIDGETGKQRVYSDDKEQEQLQRLLHILKYPATIGIGALTWWALETFTSLKPSQLIAAIESGLISIEAAMDMALPAFAAYDYDDEVKEYVYGEDGEPEYDDDPDKLTGDIQGQSNDYSRAGKAAPPRDPLAIDFGTARIDLTTLDNGVYFDLDNNGFAEKTAWIGTEDGFLALDVNGNGRIDNGSELFGDQFIRFNNQRSEYGFQALNDFDINGDGRITNEDPVYGNLLVWIDGNHNGESEESELFTLQEKNITAISVEYSESNYRDTNTGTYIAETALVELDNEENNTSISEFWFNVDTTQTTQNGTITSGNVPAIMDAIQNDETGETAQIYLDFLLSDDIRLVLKLQIQCCKL